MTSLTIHSTNGNVVVLSPATDGRIRYVTACCAYVATEADRMALVGSLRAWGVRAPNTYVRVA